jgi:hypothetical protein
MSRVPEGIKAEAIRGRRDCSAETYPGEERMLGAMED